MADSTLDSELIVLFDNWPGTAIDRTHDYIEDITSVTVGHNVADPKYKPGTKWVVYNRPITPATGAGQPRPSTVIYLKFANGTGAPGPLAKQVVVPDNAAVWYWVTNDPDDAVIIPSGVAGVLLGPMADQNWGWFWCGGICPEQYVPDLGGNFATDGNVTAGAMTAHNLAADAIGLGPVGGDTEGAFGYSLAADAA